MANEIADKITESSIQLASMFNAALEGAIAAVGVDKIAHVRQRLAWPMHDDLVGHDGQLLGSVWIEQDGFKFTVCTQIWNAQSAS